MPVDSSAPSVVVEPTSIWMFVIVAFLGYAYIRVYQKDQHAYTTASAAGIGMVILILSVILHEIAHAVVFVLAGGSLAEFSVTWQGGYVRPAPGSYQNLLPLQIMLLGFAGPCVNLCFGLAGKMFLRYREEGLLRSSMLYMTYVSFLAFRWNMLPLRPMDGSVILDGFVSIWIPVYHDRAELVSEIGTLLTIPLLLLFVILVKRDLDAQANKAVRSRH